MSYARIKPTGRKAAISQHCRECIHDPEAPGTWRQQVELCSITQCALFRFRPTSTGRIPESVLNYYDVTVQSRLKDSQGHEPVTLGDCRPGPQAPRLAGSLDKTGGSECKAVGHPAFATPIYGRSTISTWRGHPRPSHSLGSSAMTQKNKPTA